MASGIGVRELARLMNISPSQISHWENGDRVANVETVATILGTLRVSSEDRRHILELAREASKPHWLSVGVNGIPQQLAAVIECERAATAIVDWVPIGVCGLLQTPDYARAVKRAAGFDDSDVELRVMVGSGRHDVITRHENPLDYTALIGESIFHERIGTPEVLLDQFRFLAAVARLPNATVRIVPRDIGWHPGWAGPFMLFEFPDASPVVYFEHHSSGAFVSAEHDIAEYRKAIATISEVAKSPAESLDFVRDIVEREKAT
jgi:transcriptional regulator with XRE-family HTH domain